MTPLPLDQLRFGWRSHVSALYWLALLYRKPWAFVEAMVTVSRTSRFVSGLICYAHSVPYVFLIRSGRSRCASDIRSRFR